MKGTENINTKYSNPDKELIDWIYTRLDLEKEKQKSPKKGIMSTKLKTALKGSAWRKTEVLDDIIFPAMTNLIYFFEALKKYPVLSEIFEKDLIDLLKPYHYSGQGHNSNLYKFISAVADIKEIDQPEDDPIILATSRQKSCDYRVSILYLLQKIISKNLSSMMINYYGQKSQFTKSILSDFNKTEEWLWTLASSIPGLTPDEIPRREIGFKTFSK